MEPPNKGRLQLGEIPFCPCLIGCPLVLLLSWVEVRHFGGGGTVHVPPVGLSPLVIPRHTCTARGQVIGRGVYLDVCKKKKKKKSPPV